MTTTDYLNLDILFHRDGDHYAVRARNSVGSETSRTQPFTIPFTPEEGKLLTGDLPDPGHLTPQQVGQRLYEALFQGEVRDLLVRSHEQARMMAGLRLRLHVNDAAELALLPWEYLYDATEARFLALTARLSIVRYLALGEPPQALLVDPPLRVLVVLANPADIFPQLDVEAEWQQLQTVLAPLVDQGMVELRRLPHPTRNALADHLEQYPVHVLHFVGHGNGGAVSGEGGLYLVNEAGAADFVPASVLQVLLADTRDRRNALRLAFLNGCLTGRSAQVDPFAGTAQQLVQHGVPAVIAMQYSVTDGAATDLAHRFYRALARSYPVDAALAQARKGVYIQGNYLEWGTPVLFLRAPEGQLFTVAGAEELVPLLPDVECPYRGLEVFEAEHAHLYFGREDMIQRLLAKVAETNFVVVVGPSGSGKSSLVRAGLIPALAKGALTGSAQWAVATLRPGSDPIRALISALLQLSDPQTDYASRIAEVRRLANMLLTEELPLADLLDPLHERHPGLVLVVDQFEEAFTLCSDTPARDRFFTPLLAAAAHDGIKVILTLRADFWGHVLDDKQLDKPADAGLVNVLVMTRAERRAAIEQPAHAVGRHFEEGLVSLILDELEAEPGELPLLEFALTELWARQSADGLLTHAAYEAIGKVSGAIARRADETFQRLHELERRQVRTVFTRLVRVARPEEGDQDTKRRIALTELDEETKTLVQRLASARLLVTGTDADTGQPNVEIAHEALIRSWRELKEWLNRDREFLLWRQRLRTLLESWQSNDEDPDALLRGALLTEAELQAQDRPGDLDEQEHTYITASRQAEDERLQAEAEAHRSELEQAQQLAAEQTKRAAAEANRTRTFRLATVIVSVLLLIAIVTAGWAVDRQRAAQNNAATAQAESTRAAREARAANTARAMSDVNAANAQTQAALAATRAVEAQTSLVQAETAARLAQSLALAAAAQVVFDSNPMRAWLLAIEAGRRADTNQAFNTINEQSQAFNKLFTVFGHEQLARGIRWNGDESRSLSWSDDTTIRIWNATTGEPIFIIDAHQDKNINGVQWSRDENRVLSWSLDNTIRIWDTASGDLLQTFYHEGAVSGAQWNRDESRILSWGWDDTVRLWNVTSGELLHTFEHDNDVNGAQWNEDESLILSWSDDDTVRLWNVTSGELLHTFEHDNDVNGAQWNEDESLILSWSDDITVRIWNAATGELLYTCDHTSAVSGARWSSDESRILSWSDDTTIRIWNAATGELLHVLDEGNNVNGALWSKNDTHILSWNVDTAVRLWDTASGKLLHSFDHKGAINGAQWNEDESRILSWGNDGTARIWDTVSGELLYKLEHAGAINGAQWNGDESRILSWSNDTTVRIWDATTGEVLHILYHERVISSAQWSEDENRVLSLDWGDTVRLWDVDTGQLLHTYTHDDNVNGAQWNEDGSRILSWSWDGTIRLWDVDTDQLFHTFTHNDIVNGAQWNRDESRILSWGWDDTVRLWNTTSGELLHTFEHYSDINGAQWNVDESRILSWGDDITVRIWDTATGKLLYTLEHAGAIRGAEWNEDGSSILSWSDDTTVRIWNVATGEPLQILYHERSTNGAQWNEDENRVLSWSWDGTVRLWDVDTGQLLHTFTHDGNVNGAQWDEDESHVLSWSEDGTAYLWNTNSGKLVYTLHHEAGIADAQWTKDNTGILTLSWDGTLHLWNAATGEPIHTIIHNESVNGTQWKGDGSRILSWNDDDARIWNTQTGLLLQTFAGDDNRITSAQWNHSETQVMLTTAGGKIYRYYTHMEDLLAGACTRATRNLTWQEWQQYLPGEDYRKTCPDQPVHPSVPEWADATDQSSISGSQNRD